MLLLSAIANRPNVGLGPKSLTHMTKLLQKELPIVGNYTNNLTFENYNSVIAGIDPIITFSLLFFKVSGFTRMEGGADTGGFTASSFFGTSLVSKMTELHTEGALLLPLRGNSTKEEL